MKVALIGNGKTGGKVCEILKDNPPTIFNLGNRPTLEKLKNHDVVIVFVPGEAFLSLIPLLLESSLPVISGSTGMQLLENLDQKLKNTKAKWITASNFSLGMNLVYQMIKIMSKTPLLFDNFKFKIHEVHHTEKVDVPSGTALSWAEWLGLETDISSDRIGDVIGTHELVLQTENEKIVLCHKAKDRKVFAAGAVWAARKVLEDQSIDYGLHRFEDIAKQGLLS